MLAEPRPDGVLLDAGRPTFDELTERATLVRRGALNGALPRRILQRGTHTDHAKHIKLLRARKRRAAAVNFGKRRLQRRALIGQMRERAVEIAADSDEAFDGFAQLARLLTNFRLHLCHLRLLQPLPRRGQRIVEALQFAGVRANLGVDSIKLLAALRIMLDVRAVGCRLAPLGQLDTARDMCLALALRRMCC